MYNDQVMTQFLLLVGIGVILLVIAACGVCVVGTLLATAVRFMLTGD
jgi:hypothetical protein